METAAENKKFDRTKAFKIFGVVLALLCVLALIYWLIFGRNSESTDDAYVAGSQVQIVAQIEGAIAAVNVSETQAVKEGQVLFKIDPTEAKIASEKADIDLLNAYLEYQKRNSLQGDAAVSREELDHSYLNLRKLTESARQAYVNLLRTEVQSPTNAILAKRYAQIGQRVAPGTALGLLVAKDEIWVDANFKEDQIRNIRVGQPVKLESDIYGGKIEYRGIVVGFAPGTGSTLALLPAQNATGNWVKVVQRLPVRIALDGEQLKGFPLRIGLSMNVKVDTSNHAGIPLQAMESGNSQDTNIYLKQYELAESHINSILHR